MSERVYKAVNLLGLGLMRALDLTVRTSGVEHLPTTGAVILAATHVSYPDFVFIEKAAAQRQRFVRFMCRHDVWNRRAVAWGMDRMQHVPVDREAPAYAYLRARRLLRQGEAVLLFPEAGISYSYAVRPLMRGVAALARETGAPVVPVSVWGSQRVWSVGVPEPKPSWQRGRLVDVTFGATLSAAAGDDLTEWTIALGHRLTALLESLQRLPEHRPAPGERAVWYPAHLGGHAPTRAEALAFDEVPRSAITPVWGPPMFG
jgi:1-acyl-sn-glycerol-3-phosphate acyltransferase